MNVRKLLELEIRIRDLLIEGLFFDMSSCIAFMSFPGCFSGAVHLNKNTKKVPLSWGYL